MIFKKFHKENNLSIRNISLLVSKNYKYKSIINLMKNLYFKIYNLSLFISFKAFLPSLRVLKTSQDREDIIRMVRITRDIRVGSIFIINLLKLYIESRFKLINYIQY